MPTEPSHNHENSATESVHEQLAGSKQSEPLNASQINFAREQIERTNLLREIPIQTVWPFTKYICCCLLKKNQKSSFKHALKKSIRLKIGIEPSKGDRIIEKNPYLLLGYGINSYFATMVQLFKMMLLISSLAIPLMLYFATFSGTKG